MNSTFHASCLSIKEKARKNPASIGRNSVCHAHISGVSYMYLSIKRFHCTHAKNCIFETKTTWLSAKSPNQKKKKIEIHAALIVLTWFNVFVLLKCMRFISFSSIPPLLLIRSFPKLTFTLPAYKSGIFMISKP